MQTAIDEFPDSLSTEASTNMRARKQRVKWLLGFVNEHGAEWSRKKLLARYGLKYGVGPDTANKYLADLVNAEYVFEFNGSYGGGPYIMNLVDYEKAVEKEMDTMKKAGSGE